MKRWKRRELRRRLNQAPYVLGNATPPADYVLTPGGYRHKSKVQDIPHGYMVRRRGGHLELRKRTMPDKSLGLRYSSLPRVADPSASNPAWRTWASWQNGTGAPITEFVTTWVVPNFPAIQGDQTIFLFNSLENLAQTEIIQPVLQWGNSADHGGNFWVLRTWHIAPNSHASQPGPTPSQQVDPGDRVTGRITMIPAASGGFTYLIAFDGFSQLDLTVNTSDELVFATETLEAYGILSGDQYPASAMTSMSSIRLANGAPMAPPTWKLQLQNQVDRCPAGCSIPGTGSQIDIVYR